MLSSEAIRYYAIHPVEFVQDIIRATPDDKQADILNSIVVNSMTSVRLAMVLEKVPLRHGR